MPGMEIATDDLRLKGRTAWKNACEHPADGRRWRYMPVFDYMSGQLVCERCGEVLAGSLPTF